MQTSYMDQICQIEDLVQKAPLDKVESRQKVLSDTKGYLHKVTLRVYKLLAEREELQKEYDHGASRR
jgi:hypothetical protein